MSNHDRSADTSVHSPQTRAARRDTSSDRAGSGDPANRVDVGALDASIASGGYEQEVLSLPTAPDAAPGYGYGYADQLRGSGDLHLLDYVRILHKHRWIAVTSFLLVVLSTAVSTFTAIPIYEATAQIHIENEDPNIVSFQAVLEQSQRTNEYYQTQYTILRSRALARRTLNALRLWNDPRFSPPADDKAPDAFAAVRAPVDATFRWVKSWVVADPPIEAAASDETQAQSAAISRFLSSLTVSPVRNSQLVNVTFRSPDRGLAAELANGLAKSYIEQNLEVRFESSREATDWLGQQLAEQRKQVEATERALQEYRENNDALSLEDRQNIVVQKLADLNSAVTRARTERIQKEAAYNQIRAVQTNRAALDTLPVIVSNAFIQEQKSQLAAVQRQQAQLSEKLGPRHPDMVKLGLAVQAAQSRIDAEIAKVVESLRNDYQQALAQERSLSAALEQQKREALDLNRKGIDYGVLARDAAANRQVFDSLMQRMKETGVSSELRTSNIRIVDEAEVPRAPAFPRKRVNLLLSLLGGGVLAIGFAFFFEYLDSRIKNPDEIRDHLGLAFLGMIPALQAGRGAMFGNGGSPLINDGVPAGFAESFRALRTNLLFSSAEDAGRAIVVTSTGPGEGKTLVASNIAMALALAGERVLLLDADMRKPCVHDLFAKSQKPGLSNVLVGNVKVSESVCTTTVPGLWVMPAGEYPPNPAELLGSKRSKSLLESLGQHFDWLIIDSPPVMAVTDACVVAHRCTGVLFVVGSEMTARQAARQAVEQLERAKAKFVGAVLNRVDLEHNAYYYAPYYRRKYTEYYEDVQRA